MSDPTSPFNPYASPANSAQRVGPQRAGALTALCILAIILGVLGLFTVLMTGVSLVAVMQEYMPRLMNASGQGRAAPGGQQFVETMVTMSIYFSLAFMAIFIVLKLIFYAVTIVYLRRTTIRDLFASSVNEWET